MRKYIYLLVIFLTLCLSSTAQFYSGPAEYKNTLGIRYSTVRALRQYGTAFEFSYQRNLGFPHRLEGDFSFAFGKKLSYTALVGAYQWVFPIDAGFKWYVGPSAALRWNKYIEKKYFGFAMGVQAGIEYEFTAENVPVAVSLDLRPMVQLAYKFGERVDPSFGLSVHILF